MNSRSSDSLGVLNQEARASTQTAPPLNERKKEPEAVERLRLFEKQRRGSGPVRPDGPLLRWLEAQKK